MVEDPLNATIVGWRDVTEALAIVQIAPDSGQVPSFEPGQFTTLGLPRVKEACDESAERGRLVRRVYSIASSPRETRHLEFYLVRLSEGRLSPRLWALGEGGRVFMDARCKGTFTLTGIERGKDVVMVATGTGIAPFMSMLRTYRGTGLWRKLVIVHGARRAADLGYCQELEAAAKADDSVVYLPTVTREAEGSAWRGMRGRVHKVLEPAVYREMAGRELSPRDTQVLLCGNPAMIDQCEDELGARGFTVRDRANPQGNLHFERYW